MAGEPGEAASMRERTAGERAAYLDGFLAGLEEAARHIAIDQADVLAMVHAERIRTLAHMIRQMDRGLEQ